MLYDLKELWRSLWSAHRELMPEELEVVALALREHIEFRVRDGKAPEPCARSALDKIEQQLEQARLTADANVW